MKNLLAIILISVLIFSCKESDDASQITECEDVENVNGNITDQEEYDIIEAVLNEYYSTMDFLHIVEDTEVCGNSCAEMIHSFLIGDGISYDSTIVADYVLKNEVVSYWNDQFNTANLINEEELNCFFDNNGNGWGSYYAKYENSPGFLRFGRPTTNGTNEALVLYGLSCNYLCGYGYIVVLEKIDGAWQVRDRINTWIS